MIWQINSKYFLASSWNFLIDNCISERLRESRELFPINRLAKWQFEQLTVNYHPKPLVIILVPCNRAIQDLGLIFSSRPLAWFYTKLFSAFFKKCWCQIILEWKVLLKKLIYNWFTSRYFWTLTTTAHYCFIVVSYKPASHHTEFGDKVKHKLKPFPSQYKWVLTNNSMLSTGITGLLQNQIPAEVYWYTQTTQY